MRTLCRGVCCIKTAKLLFISLTVNNNSLSVREIQESDIPLISEYWLDSDSEFMKGMGVDLSKMPGEDDWRNMLMEQLSQPIEEKKSYCIIWQVDEKPVGHSNINKIIMGEEAYMHLHLWTADVRKKGYGTSFIKLTLPYFFKKFHLKKLFCEPYTFNPSPNKTMAKLGFKFIKEYTTIPGYLNFEQQVNLWELNADDYKKLIADIISS